MQLDDRDREADVAAVADGLISEMLDTGTSSYYGGTAWVCHILKLYFGGAGFSYSGEQIGYARSVRSEAVKRIQARWKEVNDDR